MAQIGNYPPRLTGRKIRRGGEVLCRVSNLFNYYVAY